MTKFVALLADDSPTIQSLSVNGLGTGNTSSVFINNSVVAGALNTVKRPAAVASIGDTDGVAA